MSQKIHVPFRIEQSMLDLMLKRAKKLGHTKSSYLRWLVERDLESGPEIAERPKKQRKLAKTFNIHARLVK